MADKLNLQRAARTVGVVQAVQDDVLTIVTPAGQQQDLQLAGNTVISRAVPARRRDLHTGARIVTKNEPNRPNHALEVLIVPSTSPYGSPIVASAPDSLTVKNLGGGLGTVVTRRAKINATTSATLDDIEVGRTVFARLAVENGQLVGAYEVIVLPEDTAFGT
jgi:hypothetical protein